MSTAQGSISPQEKEKLRKRLQKLFEKQNNNDDSPAVKSSKKKHLQKLKQPSSPNIKGSKEQQVKTNKLTPQKTSSKTLIKQKKIPSADTSKQNGFVKATEQPAVNLSKKINKTKKETKPKENKINPKETIVPRKKTKTTKTKGNVETKVSTSKLQSKSKNIKPVSSKMFSKTKKEQNGQQKSIDDQNKTSSPEIQSQQKKKSHVAKKKMQQEMVTNKGDQKTIKSNNTNLPTNKKAQKRVATNKDTIISSKKPKLTKNKSNKTKEKLTKSIRNENKNKKNSSLPSTPQYTEEEFDLNDMTGCVRGGDFDSDDEDVMEQNYWMQKEDSTDYNTDNASEESYEYNDDNEYSSENPEDDKKLLQKFNKVNEYDRNEFSGSEDNTYLDSNDECQFFDSDDAECFDSDDENEYSVYYNNSCDEEDEHGEEEEEEEGESDINFDETDYEVDEDCYNYSSEDEYSNEEYDNNSTFDFNADDMDDDDYELPKGVLEDLIIHKGTATKRELKPEDKVTFNSENEECQIIELEEQNIVKVIQQPKAYEREGLLKLKYEEKIINANQSSATNSSDSEECPELVPIIDEDGFQLYNPNEHFENDTLTADEEEEFDEEEREIRDNDQYFDSEFMEYGYDSIDEVSLGSEYEEINSDDADSILSEDINEKYVNRAQYSDSDYSIDENVWNKKHKADIIDATGFKCENNLNVEDDSDMSLNDDIKQIPSLKLYENVNLETDCSIISTTIIDNKIFKVNDKTKNKYSEIKEKSSRKINQKNSETNSATQEEQLEESMEVETEEEENESEGEEGNGNDGEECMLESAETASPPAKNVPPSAQCLKVYNTKFFNAFNSKLVMVLLKDPFNIYGTVRLTLLAGSVEIYGHSLDLNNEVEIFSPRGCSIIEISTSSEKKINSSKQQLEETLKKYEKYFALADLKSIADLFNSQTDAVVLLKHNEACKKVVQQFKKFMNENVFPNINNINVDRPLYNSEYLLGCMINTSAKDQKCLRLPQHWQNVQFTNNSRVMLTGGKGVGKSTLLRYLINRHFPQQILLIDLDIGQPEVFMPQTVSCSIIKQPLLGPGFMLNLQPEIAFAVGHTNIALCAHKYIAAVRELIVYCKSKEEYQNLPWLINTMGYNKGFGLELISVIAHDLPLTDLIQLQSSKEINNFDSILDGHVLANVPRIIFSKEFGENVNTENTLNYRLHVWQSAVEQESRYQKDWEMSPKDVRFAILLARLSEALQGHAEWLTDVKPLSCSLNDLKIINLLDNTPTSTKEELAKSVEANLVYLCHNKEDNKPLKCLGIGVVRAVDVHVQQLYLIPAMPYTQLKDVNCIALGEMPLATSLFTNQGSKVKNTAPFLYSTIADNASKAIKQIYHRPRKFLTGKRKALD